MTEAVWYEIAPCRSERTATDFVGHFEGTLVGDAHKAHQTVAKQDGDITLALYWSDARCKFIEAKPDYSQCAKAIDMMDLHFAIDRE